MDIWITVQALVPFVNPYLFQQRKTETVEKRYQETASLEAFAAAHEIAKRERNKMAPGDTGDDGSRTSQEHSASKRSSSKSLLRPSSRGTTLSGGSQILRSSTKTFLDGLPFLDQLPGGLTIEASKVHAPSSNLCAFPHPL